MRLRRAPDVTFEVVDGRAILIDGAGTELITLNPVGTMVWKALDGASDPAALASRLVPELEGVTIDVLEEDIRAFLDELADLGLVSPSDAAG
jgi:hypothetical protein